MSNELPIQMLSSSAPAENIAAIQQAIKLREEAINAINTRWNNWKHNGDLEYLSLDKIRQTLFWLHPVSIYINQREDLTKVRIAVIKKKISNLVKDYIES